MVSCRHQSGEEQQLKRMKSLEKMKARQLKNPQSSKYDIGTWKTNIQKNLSQELSDSLRNSEKKTLDTLGNLGDKITW